MIEVNQFSENPFRIFNRKSIIKFTFNCEPNNNKFMLVVNKISLSLNYTI